MIVLNFKNTITVIFMGLLIVLFAIPRPIYAFNATSIQTDRLAGEDRYETSARIAQAGWDSSDFALLASGENFPDALCAAPLAAKYGAPILLTSKNRLEDSTKDELLRLKVKKLFIIGGVGVIDGKAEQAIKDLGIEVVRIAGQDRFQTSLHVAEELGNFKEAIIASGEDFPDVLSISPIAAQKGIPILLTPQDRLPNGLTEELRTQAQRTYVLGDAQTVSDQVLEQLPSPERLSGSDRYAANFAIIKAFAEDLDWSTCYLATGEDFPDALSGSVYASLTHSPVLLVREPLSQETLRFIQDHSPTIKKLIAFGGTGVVSDPLLKSLTPVTEPDQDTLEIPQNVMVTPLSISEMRITWDKVNNAMTYNIYRTTEDSGVYKMIDSVNYPSYLDDEVASGITYYYKVQAVNASGTGAYSKVAMATALLDNGALPAPTNCVAVSQGSNEILLSWQASNASYYNVYRATSYSGPYVKVTSVAFRYYTDNGLSSGSTYYYKVQSVNNTGPSEYSNIAYAITSK